MARGWESKSVESQQDEHERGTKRVAGPRTPEQRERAARRLTLELQRAKARADLARAVKPGHRAMLEQAISALDEQLRGMDGEPR
ncbi:MAG TPA: hypothetical protein PKK95_03750 [Vicinamibacterales bacterium]|nr:hypothetical protein [Acidobacteriota bacterium]HOC17355.1 hypothetical protein [Vicinamibacterales bacterium]